MKYKVAICRTVSSTGELVVEADDGGQAIDIANQMIADELVDAGAFQKVSDNAKAVRAEPVG